MHFEIVYVYSYWKKTNKLCQNSFQFSSWSNLSASNVLEMEEIEYMAMSLCLQEINFNWVKFKPELQWFYLMRKNALESVYIVHMFVLTWNTPSARRRSTFSLLIIRYLAKLIFRLFYLYWIWTQPHVFYVIESFWEPRKDLELWCYQTFYNSTWGQEIRRFGFFRKLVIKSKCLRTKRH